jgi:diguanylate cyclase (GGDEF)-like protein/PAS domain S-box-containing protein
VTSSRARRARSRSVNMALAELRPPIGRSTWAFGFVVACLVAAHTLHPTGNLGQATYVLVTLGAAVAAVSGARRQPRSRRFPWTCVALGLTFSAIGDVIFYLLLLATGVAPAVSLADAFWLAAYVALAVGLSSLVVGGRGLRRVDLDGLTDIGSFTVLAVIVVTRLSAVQNILTDSTYSLLSRTIWTSYPILDAALLGVVAHAMVSRRLRSRSGVLLGCGVALWLVADFAALLIADMAVISTWLDLGWMLGAVGLAAASWLAAAPNSAGGSRPAVARVTDARLVITFLPLLVPGVIEIWELNNGRDANPVPLFAATLALVVLAFVRSARLVKARNRQEAALEQSTQYFAALAENSSDAVIVIDRRGCILNEAPNLATMLGHPGIATTGMDVVELLRPFDREAARTGLNRWWSTKEVIADAEVLATHADGSHRWFGVRAANLSNNPVVAGMVINLRDITDRKRAEQELSHNAFHDSLTGLANRALFNDRLEHTITRTARTGHNVAVVYLDLDGFKMINDTRGHEAGDRVLGEVATRLAGVVRSSDTVSRLGGDEFAILIEENQHVLDEAETLAERILQALTAPFVVDRQQVVLSASIGIALGDISCTASSMMRDADVAMYRAKTTGKGRWALYEPGMRTAALERLELESDLRLALEMHQFRLVYQPIIALRSNRLVGFEALLRWDHPTNGVIEPDTFIPIAESNGTIVAIGRWVLDEACRTAAQWRRSYPSAELTMAVNLSGRQIATPEIVEHVASALEGSGLLPASLILELTESVLVQDTETAARRLEALRALDVRLAIDDFGTGYSSLSYLRQFPIDILKIDRSFTNTITDRSHIPAIVRGLLDLARTLNMETVAEGIELDVQLDSLRDQHCDFGQGFLFAKPLNADDAAMLIADLQLVAPVASPSR